MKKIFAFIVCLLMIFSFAGCGEPEKEAETPENTIPVVTENEPSDEVVETTPEAESDDNAGFDTSWASNDFEALLPKIPFENWTVKKQTESVYKLEVGGLKTVWNPEDPSDPEGLDKRALIQYLNGLTQYGFTLEETGENYEWLVTDANGNTAEFVCADGFCWLTITKKV